MRRFFTYIMLCSLIIACSREKPAEVGSQKPSEGTNPGVLGTSVPSAALPGQYSLEITPSEVDRNTSLTLLPVGFALDGAKIEWVVNGQVVSSPTPYVFRPSDIRKGSNIQARAIVQGEVILSDAVTVLNTPPEFTKIKIMPEVFKPGDVLFIDAEGKDADGDEVTITYEWSINGEPAGTAKQIGAPIKRGDRITIKITAFDGEKYGTPAVMKREIRNVPPMIVEHRNFSVNGNLYTYQVKASDPDGDTLVYMLKSAPQGMTIDQGTGMIRWNMPMDFKGKTAFTVSVNDGNGGEAKQDFVFELRPN
jgi:hypothetical protein